MRKLFLIIILAGCFIPANAQIRLGRGQSTSGGGSSLLTNLVASWKLEDTSDSSGNSRTLTNNNSVSFANTGKLNNCATFTAASSMSLQYASSPFNFGNTDWTISLWVYTNNAANNYIVIGKDSDTQGREYLFDISSGQFDVAVSISGTFRQASDAPTGGLSSNTWHLVTGWLDTTNKLIGIQVDGRAAVTFDYTALGTPDTGTGPFYLGRRAYVGFEGYLDGRLDDCGVWSRVLSSTERTTLWNSGTGLEYPY